MRDWEQFQYSERDGVATVTFGSDEDLNQRAFEVYRDMAELASELAAAGDRVRVLVLRGEGAGFCSGGEVEVILGRLALQDPGDVYELAQVTGACVGNLRQMPQPVVAGVNGIAAGAGAVLAMACDIRVLGESATFQFLFTRAGIAGGDTGICWLLPRVIGLGRAAELLMLGERIDSEKALEFGIANRVVPDAELERAVAEYAARLRAADGGTVALTKGLLAGQRGEPGPRLDDWTESLLMTRSDLRAYSAGFSGKPRPRSANGKR